LFLSLLPLILSALSISLCANCIILQICISNIFFVYNHHSVPFLQWDSNIFLTNRCVQIFLSTMLLNSNCLFF
jgi:hypothetical protein